MRALHTSFWVQVLGQYLRSPRITYRREKKSDPKSEGPTSPPRYSHALSRLHPSPGTAPHSMPAAGPGWKEVAKVRKGQEPRTSCLGQPGVCSLLPSHSCSLSTHCCSGPTRHPAPSAGQAQGWCVRSALTQGEHTDLVETQG